jgi:hypothetical protein
MCKKSITAARALIGLVFINSLGSFFLGCSSVPKSKDYKSFSDETAATHEFVRKSQREAHNGKFAGTLRILGSLQRKFAGDNCYRIQSMTAQWGILEPEVVFTGEPVFGAKEIALIYVAPHLADKAEYPPLQDDPTARVYRLDANAPHAGQTLDMLKHALHKPDLCVHLHRIPDERDKGRVHGLISTQIVAVAKAKPPASPDAGNAPATPANAPVEAPKNP